MPVVKNHFQEGYRPESKQRQEALFQGKRFTDQSKMSDGGTTHRRFLNNPAELHNVRADVC